MTDRSAEELEREAERIRTGIAHTTDEIKDRVSPSQMFDQAVHYLRDSDGSIAVDRLRQQIRENPLALGLIASGVAWLMLGGRRRPYVHDAAYDYDDEYDDVSRMPGSAYYRTSTAGPNYTPAPGSAYGASEASMAGSTGGLSSGTNGSGPGGGSSVRQAGASAKGMMSGLAERTGSFAKQTSRRVREMGDDMRQMGEDASDRAEGMGHGALERGRHAVERGRHAAETTRDYASRGTQSLMHAIDREPLITGAIGFAIGAVVGAMLPNTRYENRAFGRARDRMMEGAGDAFEQVKDRAEHVAEESYAAARDSAEREGLMPDEGDRPLAERLGNVAKAAAAGTAAQAEREAGEERRPMAGNSGASFGSSAAGSTGGEAATNGIGRTVGTGGAGVDQPRTGADDLSAPGAVPKRDLGSGGSGAS